MNTVKVLDHGFVTLRNLAGPTRRGIHTVELSYGPALTYGRLRPFDADDTDPANAARMSFGGMDIDPKTGEPRTREVDLKLCDYLMRNRHTTPFEMVECWVEMKMPIFVARQFVRHRTVSINEVSGRYVTLPAEWYIPETVGGKPSGSVKQGQADNLDPTTQQQFKNILNANCQRSYEDYLWALEKGVAPEEARLLLHLNHYTHWLWKQDLHNMMHFLSLRDHSHAQKQSNAYAVAVDQLLRQYLPHSMALYDKYRRQA
jgi:thymidylate synthase (FAD)